MAAYLSSTAQPAPAPVPTAPLRVSTPDLLAALSGPPSLPQQPAETLALLRALLEAYAELQGRVRELELTERLRCASLPKSALGIDT